MNFHRGIHRSSTGDVEIQLDREMIFFLATRVILTAWKVVCAGFAFACHYLTDWKHSRVAPAPQGAHRSV